MQNNTETQWEKMLFLMFQSTTRSQILQKHASEVGDNVKDGTLQKNQAFAKAKMFTIHVKLYHFALILMQAIF